jgi:4-amino-4-deoxy-L-arabinose transferase-like glycosyltransferase
MATTAAAPSAPETGTHVRADLLAVGLATVLLRLPAFFAERHLTFDDGVFGASAVAMRHGGQPFRDVFSSQGPLFLPLVWLGDLVGLRQLDSPRTLAVVAGVVLTAAVYLAGRVVTDRAGALLAAGLATSSASVLWVTGPLASDGVAIALGTVTMLLLLRWRDDLTVRRAVLLGLAIGATVSVKALAGTVILPVALVLLVQRRLAPIVAGAATSIAVHLALWLPWGPGNVWDQSYDYHLDVAGDRTPLANLGKTLSTLGDRDLPVVVAAVLALAAVLWAAHRGRTRSPTPTDREPVDEGRHERPRSSTGSRWVGPDALLLVWLGAGVLVLVAEHPMWRPHVSQLVPPLALLAARHRPDGRVLALAAVVVVPYHAIHAWEVLHPQPYRGDTEQVVAALRDLPDGALAISDDPGIVWRAGRRTTDDLVDTSILRIETGRITSRSVAEAAAAREVCAVAVRSRERWGSFADLPERLEAADYEAAFEDDRGRVLYLRDCADVRSEEPRG